MVCTYRQSLKLLLAALGVLAFCCSLSGSLSERSTALEPPRLGRGIKGKDWTAVTWESKSQPHLLQGSVTAGDSQQQQQHWSAGQPSHHHHQHHGLSDRSSTSPTRCRHILAAQLRDPQPNLLNDWWRPGHEQYVAEIRATENTDLVLFGDSLTELWRGTRSCKPFEPRVGMPGVFQQHFSTHWRTAAFGLSGDKTAHLLWRLQNGELKFHRRHHPKVVTVLIGTNDLGHAVITYEEDEATHDDCGSQEEAVSAVAAGVAERTLRVVALLRQALPRTDIVLLGLLPRHHEKKYLQGPMTWPNIFTPAIQAINKRLQRAAAEDDMVHYLDCGTPFVHAQEQLMDEKLVPDALHPSVEGAHLLASCIAKEVEKHMPASTG